MASAVEKFCSVNPGFPFEIEVGNLEELQELLSLKQLPTAILLDNMDPERIKKCCKMVPKNVLIEASGNYNESNIYTLIGTGVD